MMYEIIVFAIFEGVYKKLTAYEPYRVGEIINGEYQVIECKSMEVRIYG